MLFATIHSSLVDLQSVPVPLNHYHLSIRQDILKAMVYYANVHKNG